MSLPSRGAPATHGANLASVVNRWLSPDHPVGQWLLAARMRAQLALWRPRTAHDGRLKDAIRRAAPAYTMVDLPRLRHLADLARRVAADRIEGAIVECGTWRGGGLALIDWVLREAGARRALWGFDSFAGLPPPGARDGEDVQRKFFAGWCAASERDVMEALGALGGDSARVRLVSGWLSDTLAVADTGPIALLNIDVDWYDSVKTALDVLVDRVVPGGFVNIDDYNRWPGCDEAVHDFMAVRGMPPALLQRSARYGAWFRKQSDAQ